MGASRRRPRPPRCHRIHPSPVPMLLAESPPIFACRALLLRAWGLHTVQRFPWVNSSFSPSPSSASSSFFTTISIVSESTEVDESERGSG